MAKQLPHVAKTQHSLKNMIITSPLSKIFQKMLSPLSNLSTSG
jgi:hypothetical protein